MSTFRGALMTLALTALILTGCAGPAGEVGGSTPGPGATRSTDASDPAPAGSRSEPGTSAREIRGRLGGDAALEGGCLWIESDGTRYELMLPDGATADTDALTVTTADGTTFAVGDEIVATGQVRGDMATVCQVGPVLEVGALSAG